MSGQVKLGLTFYGGVSLAVFEAGIAYELVRAVQYSRETDKPDSVPRINVDVVTGTSAGGLAAVQMAAALGGTNTEEVLARMLSIWANDADIQALLPASSFDQQGFLDNQRLRDRVEDVLETASFDAGARLEEDLDAYLTLTNFSGLREPVLLADGDARIAFPTTRHVEYEHFRSEDVTDPGERERFVQAAAITAGFPVAFPPALKTSSAIEEGKSDAEATRFVYLDGGLMDNRPLGKALDVIAEKPAEKRLFFFIDPNETWVPPSYGAADLESRRLDPAGIYFKLGAVARSDSIYQDLGRVQRMNDAFAVLEPLSRQVFSDAGLRSKLLAVYPGVVQRHFNPQVADLWLLVADSVGPEVRAEWERVGQQGRFALRARLHELVARLRESDYLGEGDVEAVRTQIDTAEGWSGYYGALRELRALDKRFQQLKFDLWHRHFKHERRPAPGAGHPRRQLAPDLQDRLRNALSALNEAAEKLRAERDGLAEELLGSQLMGRVSVSDEEKREVEALFYDYARSMQVLEALSGVSSSPNLSVRRITPFDIYADGTDLGKAKPLAGGALGAFGGFLDRGWRINDFLVGRLAMRAHLRREALIPGDAFEAYQDWSNARDTALTGLLTPGSEEATAMTRFAAMDAPDGGFEGDQQKPAVLLRDAAMDVDMLPGSRIARVVRKLLGSTRRILGMNRDRLPYSALTVLRPGLLVGAWMVWVLEQTLRPVPHADGDTSRAFRNRLKWYLAVLALGFVLGLALGAFLG